MNANAFPWKTTIAAICFLATAGLTWHSCHRAVTEAGKAPARAFDLAEKGVEKLPEIAEKFRSGHITTTFRQSVTGIQGTQGDVLEVATTKNDETFSRAEESRLAGVYLGTTVAEIRAPVTFRYHVRLSEMWRLETRGNVCLVVAPRIHASQPPAIHTGDMVKRAESGWAKFDKNEKLDELEKSLTSILEMRAVDHSHMDLALEAARQSVAAYVRSWLMKEDHWREDRFHSIIVAFPDELTPRESGDLNALDRGATLRLDN